MAPGDRGGFILEADGEDTTGSRNERVTSLSLPTLWMSADLLSDSMTLFSSSVISIEWDSTQWLLKDLEQPKDSLQMKHIRMGLTGTTVGRDEARS
jgi:hypothetical protein